MVTKSNVRILILLACGIALILASPGCKKKEDISKPNDTDVVGPEEPGVDIPPDKGPGAGADIPPDKEPGADVPPDKEPTPGKIYVVEPLVGIDKVRFGMTVEEMKEILGEPRSRGFLHEYLDAGFGILSIKNNTVTIIACGDRAGPNSSRVKNCTCQTSKGIGMGSSRQDVVEAYGAPSSTQVLPTGPVILKYDALNAEFLLLDDKLSYMSFTMQGFGVGVGVLGR